jgi:hypothetical protein
MLSRAFTERICPRGLKFGVAALTRPEQVFWAIWNLVGEVDNGGFAQYAFNSTGDDGALALEALVEVGALEPAKVVRDFGAASIIRSRKRMLDRISHAVH